MKRKILTLFLITTMTLSLVACGKQKDTGILVQVGDTNNDTGKNDLTAETNDVEESTENAEEEVPVVSDDDYMKYITGCFVAENGDVYKFNVDGTYTYYIMDTGVTQKGTYDTDGKTYMTLKCTSDNSLSNKDDTTSTEVPVENPSTAPVAYQVTEPSEDGKSTIVTEYDELGNVIRQYIINQEYKVEIDECTSDNKDEENTISEIKYKLSKTTMTDEYENIIDVVVLTNGEDTITLQKQFDLN